MIKEFISKAMNAELDVEKIRDVEEKFDTPLNELGKKLVSVMGETLFLRQMPFVRFLAYDELLDAEEDMNVEFSKIHTVPFFFLSDNDFVCYDGQSKDWCIFNIVDELDFSHDINIYQLLGAN